MHWLSNKVLARKIRDNATQETLNAFHGIYSIDELPNHIPFRPFLIIVNTHTKNLPGEHWIAIFIDKNRHGEIFDSLALPVCHLLIQWMNMFTLKWNTNKRTLQHPLSSTCGAFTLYFILNRLHVANLDSVTATFDSNLAVNERILEIFYVSLK